MKIKRQFKRQNRIYIFSILAPIIIWMESLVYMQLKAGDVDTFVLYGLGSIVGITTVTSLLIHMITSVIFWRKVDALIGEMPYFEEESLKIGRILVNEKFILDYGMFRKRVISIDEIFCVKNRKEFVPTGNGRGGYYENRIVLLRKGAKEIKLYAPTDFFYKESEMIVKAINDAIEGKRINREIKELGKKYPCDFPFYSFLGICIVPIMGVLIWLFPYIRDLFVDHQDVIKTFLFCVSYEEIIRKIIVILLYLFLVP